MMEFVIGFQGKDFVLLASDATAAHSIVVFKRNHDKIMTLGEHSMMAICGEEGDSVQFSEYIQKNLQLYRIKNGYEISSKGMISFTRKALAESLRSKPYMVHSLIAGYDQTDGHTLHFLDYLASGVQVPFAAHGYGSYFTLSLLDRWHKPDLSREGALLLLKKCMAELKKRFIISLPEMTVKIVDKEGIHTLPALTEQDYFVY